MLSIYLYKKGQALEKNVKPERLPEIIRDQDNFVWVDFNQPVPEEVKILAHVFNFHHLTIEDCLSIDHHPKLDDYKDYLFIVFHGIVSFNIKKEKFSTTEIDFYLGKNYLVSYHKEPILAINLVKLKDLEKMSRGADYFLAEVMDNVINSYEPDFEQFESDIVKLENIVFTEPSPNVLNRTLELKKDIQYLKKISFSMQNVLAKLSRDKHPLLSEGSQAYFMDVYDYLVRMYSLAESYHNLLGNIPETYLSISSKKLNDKMGILTVFSTVLMPLTFITGLYGMNFKNMPELEYEYGYFIVLGIMLVMSVILILFFKRQRWL